MSETIDKAWINLWLPELNEPQVTMLLAHIEALITDVRIDELETFFVGLDVWQNPDGTDQTLDVPKKKIKDRIKELKEKL